MAPLPDWFKQETAVQSSIEVCIQTSRQLASAGFSRATDLLLGGPGRFVETESEAGSTEAD